MPDIFLTSSYLAPISWFVALVSSEKAFVEQYDSYMKQTYRNRCVVMGSQGKVSLTLPVESSKSGKILMKDVRISSHGNWRHLHLGALMSCYNNTPYFEYYVDDFAALYQKDFEFLVDLNEAFLDLILSLLQLSHIHVELTSDYRTSFSGNELDLRTQIHPKHPSPSFFVPKPYYQIFSMGTSFVPDLSIVDLLFNMGPESISILKDSFNPLYAPTGSSIF